MAATTDVEDFIRRRLAELEDERVRLEQALRALGTDHGDKPSTPRQASKRATSRAASSRRPARRSPGRAPRGQNKQAILEFVSANPGATAPQIAEGTGIDRGVIYSAVSRLASSGQLRKDPLTNGQVAYHVA
jgi:hypothetical protein